MWTLKLLLGSKYVCSVVVYFKKQSICISNHPYSPNHNLSADTSNDFNTKSGSRETARGLGSTSSRDECGHGRVAYRGVVLLAGDGVEELKVDLAELTSGHGEEDAEDPGDEERERLRPRQCRWHLLQLRLRLGQRCSSPAATSGVLGWRFSFAS
jgi:hypothetical protein